MDKEVYNFVEKLNMKGSILDVGSLDINGNVKALFDDYIGLDMREGNNVDVIANAQNIPYENEQFDNVLCLEMLEHDTCFWKSIDEMIRVLKIGGKLVVTARGIGFPKHSYPSDYWRFTDMSFKLLFKDLEDVFVIEKENGVFGYGTKRRIPK